MRYRCSTLLIFTALAAVLCQFYLANATVPRLFTESKFDVVDLVDAVNHFVDMGEARSIAQMKEIVDCESSPQFNVRERLRWVLRLLYFESKRREAFDLRGFPDYPFSENSCMPYWSISFDQWPIYPVVKQGGSYFVLYEMNHTPRYMEDISAHIASCRRLGRFKSLSVDMPNDAR